MSVISLPDFDALPAAEKIKLVQTLWERIAERPDDVPVSEEARQVLDRRLAAHEQAPDRVTTWDALVSRVRTK